MYENDVPRAWHALGWFTTLLCMLYLANTFPAEWDNIIAVITLGCLTIILAWGHEYRRVIYLKWLYKRDDDEPVKTPRVIANLNTTYSNDVKLLTISPEQQMAKHVLMQSGQGFKVDLTERYWIADKHYINIGFSSPDEWRETMGRWEEAGAVRRKNPNATNSERLIGSKPALVRAAGGQRLSAPPPHS